MSRHNWRSVMGVLAIASGAFGLFTKDLSFSVFSVTVALLTIQMTISS